MATNALLLMTSLSGAQRTRALERFALLHPPFADQITQTWFARGHHVSLSIIKRWLNSYREHG
ncbi:MAG TPA: hypothetical protein VKX46_18865 [Ktedonobacteraceae bacterium]|nr:hypothetical protein [Ktedonobacteraceae bacterium]